MNVPNAPTQQPSENDAKQHVADAQQLLKTLQQRLEKNPELDEAIVKLELALSTLTLQTGGLL